MIISLQINAPKHNIPSLLPAPEARWCWVMRLVFAAATVSTNYPYLLCETIGNDDPEKTLNILSPQYVWRLLLASSVSRNSLSLRQLSAILLLLGSLHE